MVVHVVGVFFNLVVVVVCPCLILRVLMALVVGMLAVNAMQMAWHVDLTVLGRGLAITARVLVVKAMSFKAATIAITSRPAIANRPAMAFAAPRMAVVALLAFQEPLELLPIAVALFELMAKLALGSRMKLLVVLPLYQAIADNRKKNTLKVLHKSLQCLAAELAPAADLLCLI